MELAQSSLSPSNGCDELGSQLELIILVFLFSEMMFDIACWLQMTYDVVVQNFNEKIRMDQERNIESFSTLRLSLPAAWTKLGYLMRKMGIAQLNVW